MQLAGFRNEMMAEIEGLRVRLSAPRNASARKRAIDNARRAVSRIKKRAKLEIDDRVTRNTPGPSNWYPRVHVNQARLGLEKKLEEITAEAQAAIDQLTAECVPRPS